MHNMNRFPQYYMYAVVPVNYCDQGSMFGGNYTSLRNLNNPDKVLRLGLRI